MKLYYSPGACSLSPHIVLRETGLPFDLVMASTKTHKLADGTDYYTINPKGYVPLLELDDGQRLTEGPAIVQYLADLKPEAGLIAPAGTMERVRVVQWLAFVSSELHKTFSPWLWHADTAASTRQVVLDRLATRFAELDRLFAKQPFLAGARYSVADAYAFTILNWARVLRIDLAPYPAVAAYLERVGARPAVQAAMEAEGLITRQKAA